MVRTTGMVMVSISAIAKAKVRMQVRLIMRVRARVGRTGLGGVGWSIVRWYGIVVGWSGVQCGAKRYGLIQWRAVCGGKMR